MYFCARNLNLFHVAILISKLITSFLSASEGVDQSVVFLFRYGGQLSLFYLTVSQVDHFNRFADGCTSQQVAHFIFFADLLSIETCNDVATNKSRLI